MDAFSSDNGGMDFFNPDLFSSNIETEEGNFQYGDVKINLEFVHGSNQFIEKFVSRVVWPSAEAMCEYFVQHPELVKDKTVLELGSGTGLCGLVVSKLGASKVVMTDYNDEAISIIDINIDRNSQRSSCSAFKLSWGDEAQADYVRQQSLDGGLFDLVIGTDVVYEPECIEPLFKSSKYFMKQGGQFFLANHKYRYARMEDDVKRVAGNIGYVETRFPSIIGDDGPVEVSYFVHKK